MDCIETEKDILRASMPHSMTSGERMVGLVRAVEYLARCGIQGNFVECGVWKGGSSMTAALALRLYEGTDRDICSISSAA